MKNIFATYFDKNFIVRFVALHTSMEQHCKPYKLYVLALCQEAWWFLEKAQLPNVVGVPLSAVLTKNLAAVEPMRGRDVFIWTTTSHWIQYLLQTITEPHVCFIDCDSWWWSKPDPVWEEIGDSEIAITPHRFSPVVRHYVNNGIFNAGFIYMRRTSNALACIAEWCEAALRWDRGLCSSQEELNSWPEKYGAYSVQHPGLNLSVWNQLGQYHYHQDGGTIFVDGYPLIWYHYHGGPNQGAYRLHYFVSNNIYPPYQRAFKSAKVKADGIVKAR